MTPKLMLDNHFHHREHGWPIPATADAAGSDPRAAFSLLELMVVLVILAVVATVAVQAFGPRVEASRIVSTQKTLEQIQRSVVGVRDLRQSDGTPILDGFLADVGRLPLAISPDSNDPEAPPSLEELWNNQSKLALEFPFQLRPGPREPIDFSDIQLPCGWRGPYLQLPVGARTLVDSWGRPFELVQSARGEVTEVRTTPLPAGATDPLSTDFALGRTSVAGLISIENDLSAPVQVNLLVPDSFQSLQELAVLTDEAPERLAFKFSDVPVGLRALVVKVGSERQVKYLQVPHGGLTISLQLGRSLSTVTQAAEGGDE